jgi:tetratricopeptide (TPR) repeat protein
MILDLTGAEVGRAAAPDGRQPAGVAPGLRDRIVAFTGRLRSLSRPEAAELVVRAGGVVRSGVSRETSYLVTGEAESPGAVLGSRKLRLAARLNGEGAYIRIIDEPTFLRLAGVEPVPALDERYYTAEDVRALYGFESRDLRALERLRLVRPVLRTNADRYYRFGDLLVLREVREALARGASLGRVARRLRLERHGQMQFRFEAACAPRIVEFRLPEPEGWSADDWYELGCQCDEDAADLERALVAYEHALELDPHHVGSLVNLGNVYYRLGQVDEARRLYERALALDPQNPNVHYNLGNVYDDLEEFRTAIRFFESAIRLRPANADAHFNLGLVHDRIGSVDQVRLHMQAYLRLEPDGEMAEVAREYLTLTADEAPA